MMASTVYKVYQQLFYLCLHNLFCVDVGKIIISNQAHSSAKAYFYVKKCSCDIILLIRKNNVLGGDRVRKVIKREYDGEFIYKDKTINYAITGEGRCDYDKDRVSRFMSFYLEGKILETVNVYGDSATLHNITSDYALKVFVEKQVYSYLQVYIC